MSESRHRTRTTGPENVTFKVTYKGSEVSYTPPITAFLKEETMDDYVDPGFHTRVRDGEVFCNPCDFTVNTERISSHMAEFRYWWLTEPQYPYIMVEGNLTARQLQLCNWLGYNSVPPPPNMEDAVASAKHYALAHVDSTPYEFFEDLAEIRETIQFLRSPLQSIKQVMRAYARRRSHIYSLYTAKKQAKALSNLWKTYRFALAPLIRSAMTAAEALAEFDSLERPARRTAHGFSEVTPDVTLEVQEPWTILGGTNLIRTYEKRVTGEGSAHASIHYEVSNPLVDWKFALGLRLKDIPTTAWEIVPLSFMVDRLLDIKKMIQGLVNIADPTVTFLAGSATTRTTMTADVSCVDIRDALGAFLDFDLASTDNVFYEQFKYKRVVWEPRVSDTLPQFTPGKLVADVTSILDLLAIIIGKAL